MMHQGDARQEDDKKTVIHARIGIFSKPWTSSPNRAVPFDAHQVPAKRHILAKAVFLDQFAELHIVIGPHGDGTVTADGAIDIGAQKIERADADMPRAVRVARLPRLGVRSEEQCECAAEHAQQRAGHPQLWSDGEMIDPVRALESRRRGR
jgi:hypothetical protein